MRREPYDCPSCRVTIRRLEEPTAEPPHICPVVECQRKLWFRSGDGGLQLFSDCLPDTCAKRFCLDGRRLLDDGIELISASRVDVLEALAHQLNHELPDDGALAESVQRFIMACRIPAHFTPGYALIRRASGSLRAPSIRGLP